MNIFHLDLKRTTTTCTSHFLTKEYFYRLALQSTFLPPTKEKKTNNVP